MSNFNIRISGRPLSRAKVKGDQVVVDLNQITSWKQDCPTKIQVILGEKADKVINIRFEYRDTADQFISNLINNEV